MAFNKEFAFQCLERYRGDFKLGFRRSLVECNFFDTFRCFPECALDFYKQNGVGVENFWETFNRNYSNKLGELKLNLEVIVNNRLRKRSNEDLRDVSTSYLVENCHGIAFLDDSNLGFYLLAIIIRCCDGDVRELGLALDFMVSHLLSIAKQLTKSARLVHLDKEVIPVASKFLLEIYNFSPDEFYDAKVALDIYWAKTLPPELRLL